MSARCAGIYRWTINFSLRKAGAEAVEDRLQMKFEQSAVTLQEVLDGLDPDDRRLHDEIVLMVDGRA